jgi:hypothetical protein
MPLSSHRTVTSLTPYREVFGSSPDLGPGMAVFPLFPQANTTPQWCYGICGIYHLTVFLPFMERHDIAAQYSGGSGIENRPGAQRFVILFSYFR